MLTSSQLELIEERLQDVIEEAQEIYGIDLDYVPVTFNMKGRIAGKAWYTRTNRMSGNRLVPTAKNLKLEFNQEAFEKDWHGMYTHTIPHEVAHLVCAVAPHLGNNHDSGWRRVDISLGGSGETYHNLELTPGRKTRRFMYTASCGTEIDISHVIHNRIQKGQQRTLNSTKGKLNRNCHYREI